MTVQTSQTDGGRPPAAGPPIERWRIDTASPVPLYYQLSELLRTWIVEQAAAGAQLPSEPYLVDNLSVSRATVRKAIERLETEGLLYRRRGTGTFVAAKKLPRTIRIDSSLADYSESGRAVRTDVLHRAVEPVSDEIAERLGVRPAEPVIVLRRLRFADARPFAMLHNWLPAGRFGAVLEADLEQRSLYDVIQQDAQVKLGRAVQRMQARLPLDAEVEALDIDAGEPVMRVVRQTFDDAGAAVEWSDCIYPAELCEFVATLEP